MSDGRDLVRRISKQAQAYCVSRRRGQAAVDTTLAHYRELKSLLGQLEGNIDGYSPEDLDAEVARAAVAYAEARRMGARGAGHARARYERLAGLCDRALRLVTPAAPVAPSPDVEPARPWWDRD